MSEHAAQVTVDWSATTITVSALTVEGVVVASREVDPHGDVAEACDAMVAEVGATRIVLRAQPGLVVVDGDGRTRAVLVGDEPDTGPDAGWLSGRLPGKADDWVAAVGAAPAPHWTLAKLSYTHRALPDDWAALSRACTPLSWLALALTGAAVTTADDAAQTGAWAGGAYRPELLAIVDTALDWAAVLPTVVAGPDLGNRRGIPVVAG